MYVYVCLLYYLQDPLTRDNYFLHQIGFVTAALAPAKAPRKRWEDCFSASHLNFMTSSLRMRTQLSTPWSNLHVHVKDVSIAPCGLQGTTQLQLSTLPRLDDQPDLSKLAEHCIAVAVCGECRFSSLCRDISGTAFCLPEIQIADAVPGKAIVNELRSRPSFIHSIHFNTAQLLKSPQFLCIIPSRQTRLLKA